MKNDIWPYGIGWRPDPQLKPCPFCGSVAILGTVGNDFTKKRGFDVKCSSNMCRFGRSDRVIKQSLDWLKPKVIAAWNKRVSDGCQDVGKESAA